MSLEEQATPIIELISFARNLDAQGKRMPTRSQLIAERMEVAERMGNSIHAKQAARDVDNARRRVRNAADKAEHTLQHIARHDALWDWTDPDKAMREMRTRHFGPEFVGLPWTDIEEGLRLKGNVLFIIAIYPSLKWAILARLRTRGVDNVQGGPAERPDVPTKTD
jgi:hypothetical protein